MRPARNGPPQLGLGSPALRARIASKRALALFRACLLCRLAGPELHFMSRLQTRRTTTASTVMRRSRSMDFGWQIPCTQFTARGDFSPSRQPLQDAQERARPPAPHRSIPATGIDGQLGCGHLGGRLLVLLLFGLKHQWSRDDRMRCSWWQLCRPGRVAARWEYRSNPLIDLEKMAASLSCHAYFWPV